MLINKNKPEVMKRLRFNEQNLLYSEASLVAPLGFQFIKITKSEAAKFKNEDYLDWSDILSKYGQTNLLQEGEYYEGYILRPSANGAEVNHLCGKLSVERDASRIKWKLSFEKEAFANQTLLHVDGKLRKLWSFFRAKIEPSLRDRIIASFAQDAAYVEVSFDEYDELRTHLGLYAFKRYFTED